jgi:hypothetical protein
VTSGRAVAAAFILPDASLFSLPESCESIRLQSLLQVHVLHAINGKTQESLPQPAKLLR